MQGYPEEWIREFKNDNEFALNPHGRCADLCDMAYAMYRRREISSDQLQDMLELAESGKEWGLTEQEEAWDIGLFTQQKEPDEPGQVRIANGKAWIVK